MGLVGANAKMLLLIATAYNIWSHLSKIPIPLLARYTEQVSLCFFFTQDGVNLHQNGCDRPSMLSLVICAGALFFPVCQAVAVFAFRFSQTHGWWTEEKVEEAVKIPLTYWACRLNC